MAYRVLMLLENTTYPEDVRVRKEATSLVAAGYEVILIGPGREDQPAKEAISGVRVYRFRSAFAQHSRALSFFVEYAWATLWMTWLTYWVWLRHGFDALHLHNPPDTLFAIAMPFRLLGKAVVYDNHDLVPELMQVKFKSPLLKSMSTIFEGLSCRYSDAVIAANDFAKELLIQRHGLTPEDVTIIRNGPSIRDLESLSLTPRAPEDEQVRFGFIGAIDPQDGVDSIIQSLSWLRHLEPNLSFSCRIIGDGVALEAVRQQARKLELENEVEFCNFLPWPEAMQALSECDICLDAAPLNAYHKVNEAVKVLEYMALRKPMVLTDSPGHRAAAGEAALYAGSGDFKDFAEKLLELIHNPDRAGRLGEAGRAAFESTFSWELMSCRLTSIYDDLQMRSA